MSQDRGKTIGRQFPAMPLIQDRWPAAEPCPPGRNGRDVYGIPGVAFEVKTSGDKNYRPAAWVCQAVRNSGGDVPVVAYFPPGVGIESPGKVLAMLPLPVLVDLLVKAGY